MVNETCCKPPTSFDINDCSPLCRIRNCFKKNSPYQPPWHPTNSTPNIGIYMTYQGSFLLIYISYQSFYILTSHCPQIMVKRHFQMLEASFSPKPWNSLFPNIPSFIPYLEGDSGDCPIFLRGTFLGTSIFFGPKSWTPGFPGRRMRRIRLNATATQGSSDSQRISIRHDHP